MTEAEFSKKLTGILEHAGFTVTRIESHGTGNGIPDMFVQGNGIDFWLELKSDSKARYRNGKALKVAWRPGQQAWAHQYYRQHAHNKCTLTVVKLQDMTVIIPMNRLYDKNTVDWDDCIPFDIAYLETLTRHSPSGYSTFREAVNALAEGYPDFDYDPDVLWVEYKPGWCSKDIDSTFNRNIWSAVRFNMKDYFRCE